MSKIKKNRQFYVLKFTSAFLHEKKYKVNLTYKEAVAKDKIVSIADSQMLRLIRRANDRNIDLEYLEELYVKRDKLQKDKNRKSNIAKIESVKKEIVDMMYVPEYITVEIEKNKHYEKMFKQGFIFNGKKYVRASCSASQARVSTVVFMEEKTSKKVLEWLDNGRDKSKEMSPSKYNAYLGTASSATKVVSTPRVCVVPDCFRTDQVRVNWVDEVKDEDLDDIITEKVVDVTFNLFDGNGLVSPKQAEKWALELELEHLPAQWCIRASWIKGMVSVFDFHKFCEEVNGGNYMTTDLYGEQVDLREIDVILTESQFKLWDSYENYRKYEENCKKNGLSWGISIFTPEKDKDVLELNYQAIQTLNLTEEDIVELCKDTVGYFKGVSYEDVMYTMLFCLGNNIQEDTVRKFLSSGDKYWLQSLFINNDMINDKFIKKKIYDLLKIKINNAKIGRIHIDGNYQVIVPDSYAFMEHVCGLEVKGLLNKGEFFSGYWNNKSVTRVDCMRSPLTFVAEHYVVDIVRNEKTDEWFKYYYTGMVANCHDEHTLRFAGSDYDYDIIASTSNQTVINSVYENEYPVVYKAPKAKKCIITQEELYKADLFTFDSLIGQITNCSTIFYCLLNEYDKDDEEYKTLWNRIMMSCKLQSAQIDKAKIGRHVKGIPKIWKRYKRNEDNDLEIELNNKLLCDKHPYFFTYLYKTTMKQYRKYNKDFDNSCLEFGINYKELLTYSGEDDKILAKKDKYCRFLPVLNHKSEMNMLCNYMEKIDDEIKLKNNDDNDFDFECMLNKNIVKNKNTYKKCLNVMLESAKKYKLSMQVANGDNKHTAKMERRRQQENFYSDLKDRLSNVCSNIDEVTNYMVEIFYIEKPSYNKTILWDCYGKYIFKNIKNNLNIEKINIPVFKDDGEYKYLNKNFAIMEVDLVSEDKE